MARMEEFVGGGSLPMVVVAVVVVVEMVEKVVMKLGFGGCERERRWRW